MWECIAFISVTCFIPFLLGFYLGYMFRYGEKTDLEKML